MYRLSLRRRMGVKKRDKMVRERRKGKITSRSVEREMTAV
jgi:hypothetical protein